ncbi:MAG TPA: serine hydrolase domain-containing protein [Vicinamibacterales bacterium]|nr:serine hydrolase domain-containing protein [Vicinamibacterales bacterium]
MLRRLQTAVALCIALTPVASTQDRHNTRFDAIVALTEAKMKEYKVPGVALGIYEEGVITTRALGVTNVEDPIPVNDHTVFPIASISKTFAATMVMRLVEQGKLDLEAPVRTYLPEFKVRDEAVSRDVTVWNLLTHSAGWEGQVSGPERGTDTLRNFVATVMPDLMQIAPFDSAQGRPPAAVWSYNNAGFSVSGRVIEAVTGTSINQAVRDLIFTPLGLAHAGSTAGEFMVNRFASGHGVRNDASFLQRPFSPSVSVTAGGVGLCITDLLNYARFHLGDGTAPDGRRLLSTASLESMRTAQLHKQSTDDDIGLGWHLRNVGSLRVAAHGGTLAGHILLLEIVPEKNFAVGILTNSITGWRLIQDVEREVLKQYHGATFPKNHAIAHRGLVETLPNVEPLASQPDPAPYVGRYLRPMNAVAVRVDAGRLVVQEIPNGGEPRTLMPIAFFGPDRAVVTEGNDKGQSIEFVRDTKGAVNWVRVVGRVAVREHGH